jgi:hypothetical protein
MEFFTKIESFFGFSEKTKKYHGKIVGKLDGKIIHETVDPYGFDKKEDCINDLQIKTDKIKKMLNLQEMH